MRFRKRLPANSRGENKLAYGVMAVSVLQSFIVLIDLGVKPHRFQTTRLHAIATLIYCRPYFS
jgi:hypothetical protein